MHWGLFTSVFVLAIFKFMFAPFTGSGLGLPYWETYIASVAGGSFSATIFYFFSEVILKYSHRKKVEKLERSIKEGRAVKKKKIFTKTNRTIIKVKRSLGIVGICFFGPLFLSAPIGSMIAAKFYGKMKKTYPLIILGMFVNAVVTTALAYLIF
jgi:uncharacterized membrane protein